MNCGHTDEHCIFVVPRSPKAKRLAQEFILEPDGEGVIDQMHFMVWGDPGDEFPYLGVKGKDYSIIYLRKKLSTGKSRYHYI
jgi:hypothetical protein